MYLGGRCVRTYTPPTGLHSTVGRYPTICYAHSSLIRPPNQIAFLMRQAPALDPNAESAIRVERGAGKESVSFQRHTPAHL